MSAPKALPSQTLLQECFDYNQETGIVHWKERSLHHFESKESQTRWNKAWAGKKVGCKDKAGYLQVTLDSKTYRLHRIIYKLVTGVEPHLVDHENGIKSDNRWLNLRNATPQQNVANSKKSSTNTTGFKGVCFNEQFGKYKATIRVNRKSVHLGYRDDPKEAYDLYCRKATTIHGEFANFG